MVDRSLSMKQRRTPPAVNPYVGRRGLPVGGVDQVSGVRTLAPGIDNQLSRFPGDSNDDRIVRDRIPFYERDRFIPPPATWTDWTAAGPRRPELHMRNTSYRRETGTDNTRFPVVNSPTTGMHTMVAPGTGTIERFVMTPQMVPTGQDRLSPGQYSGQTYSQTTVVRRSPSVAASWR